MYIYMLIYCKNTILLNSLTYVAHLHMEMRFSSLNPSIEDFFIFLSYIWDFSFIFHIKVNTYVSMCVCLYVCSKKKECLFCMINKWILSYVMLQYTYFLNYANIYLLRFYYSFYYFIIIFMDKRMHLLSNGAWNENIFFFQNKSWCTLLFFHYTASLYFKALSLKPQSNVEWYNSLKQ